MECRGANIDWINHLPPEIIEKILILLPIKDAVKTSILSRSWRYKWISIPELDFGDGCGTALNLVKGINKVLLVHQGPIRKFKVSVTMMTVMRKVDQWLHMLSKHDINNLQVDFGASHKVPSCLFDCKKLTHLELSNCHLNVPPNFEGFINLKTLKLRMMAVDINIARLISKSPLLDTLSLVSYSASNDTITVSAPNVRFLNLQGQFKDICLEDSPVLVDLSISFYSDHRDCKLIKVLGGAPNLEKLKDILYLRIGCNRGALSTTFNYLKVMTVSGYVLGESEGIPLVLELLTSAPNLENLVIQCRNVGVPKKKVDSGFWQKEYLFGHCFMKLKNIKMVSIYCVAPEIEFAKFMLQSSPVLEKMEIRTSQKSKVAVSRVLKNLPKLRQASQAVITFYHQAQSHYRSKYIPI